jgi:ribosomal protein S18 acetylase RimI-like enzyme
VAEILESTAVFRRDEVDVALELFDEAVAVPPASSTYAFLGAFTPDGELAAYACFGPTPATDRTWDLYWIAVHRAAQGRGGGTRLLSEVERRLQELQARMLVVETSSRSEYDATRAFYRARGYVEAAHVREFYAPADDRIILTKRFHEPADGRGVVAS